MSALPIEHLCRLWLVVATVVKIKNEKRYRDNDNILMVYLFDKYVNDYNMPCFKNVDNNICFNVDILNENHPKSFTDKNTNLNVDINNQTSMDFN